jgi:hypothetical protein
LSTLPGSEFRNKEEFFSNNELTSFLKKGKLSFTYEVGNKIEGCFKNILRRRYGFTF